MKYYRIYLKGGAVIAVKAKGITIEYGEDGPIGFAFEDADPRTEFPLALNAKAIIAITEMPA